MTSILADPGSRESLPPPAAPAPFPVDLTAWVPAAGLLRLVGASVTRTRSAAWFGELAGSSPVPPADDLLALVCYCYLRGIYHSIDVVRRLETDEALREMRDRVAFRAEQVRRLRRDCRQSLTESLARALYGLWERRHHPDEGRGRHAGNACGYRPDFAGFEPFLLRSFHHLAQDRIDRAVVFDSMALDE